MTDTITTTAAPGSLQQGGPTEASSRQRRRIKVPALGVIFGTVWIVTLVFLTLFADWLPFIRAHDQGVYVDGAKAVNYKLGPGSIAWFGTDAIGEDVFAKCIYFARNSLQIGLSATFIGLFIGGGLGLMAGYFRGWVDRVVSIFTDCLLAIPALVFAVVLVSRLDTIKLEYTWLEWLTRKQQIVLTLSILAIAPLARIVRAQTLSFREREFVLAARSIGASSRRVVLREILPNLVPTMVTVAFTSLGILIASEGALAFLGLGLTDSWGFMIEDNRRRIEKAWWATVFPCLMLFFTVFAFNLLGDRLARRFDIREAAV